MAKGAAGAPGGSLGPELIARHSAGDRGGELIIAVVVTQRAVAAFFAGSGSAKTAR